MDSIWSDDIAKEKLWPSIRVYRDVFQIVGPGLEFPWLAEIDTQVLLDTGEDHPFPGALHTERVTIQT